jgi:magnesium transporter
MKREPLTLQPDEKAQTAAQAFERYDLVSAPVVDKDGKLVGRVTVNEVVDYIREETESEVLSRPACARRRTSSPRCGTR